LYAALKQRLLYGNCLFKPGVSDRVFVSAHETAERVILTLYDCRYHLNFDIDTIVDAILKLFAAVTHVVPRYKNDGGSVAENLGLQNIQARVRMVVSISLSSLIANGIDN
jgi:NH3-dependent NAD+ synthetase